MAETEVKMPQMGESIFEGTVTKWLKKKGDKVQRDEPLFEISTDKIDTEIPSPAAGVLQDILVKEGQTVQINTIVAIIGDGSGKPAAEAGKPAAETRPEAKEPSKPAAKEPAAPQAKAPTTPPGPATVAGPTPTTGGEKEEAEEEEEEEAGRDGVRSSPLVRRIAKEHGVDLSALAGRGTGINGRITKRDILSYIEQGGEKKTAAARGPSQPVGRPTPAAPATSLPLPPPMTFTGDVERVPMTAMRKAIAD